jgi:hypothetical protein
MKINRAFFFSFSDLALIAGALTLLLLQLNGFANDPGVGWHLKTGEMIYSSGIIPRTDPFLASAAVRSWVSDQWFSDYLFFALFNAGSWPLVYAVFTIIFLFTFFYVLVKALELDERISTLAIGITSFLVFRLATIHFILRPHILSFLFFSVILYGIYALRKNLKLLHCLFIIFPIIFVLWANIHPSFFLGFILLVLFAAGSVFDLFLLKRRTLSEANFNYWLLLIALCAAATLINPYGFQLHRSILSLVDSDLFASLYSEWKSMDFKNPEAALFEVLLVGIFSTGFLKADFFRKLAFFDLLLLLLFGHMAATSIRILPYFGIAAAYPFALAISEFLPNWRGRSSISLLVIISALLLGGVLWFRKIPLYAGTYGPDKDRFPFESLDYLKQQGTKENPVAVFSTPNWGGFITWYGEGKVKAILDDRSILLGEKIYKDYLQIDKGEAGFDDFAKQFAAKYALLPLEHLPGKMMQKYEQARILFSESNKLAIVTDVR